MTANEHQGSYRGDEASLEFHVVNSLKLIVNHC